MIIKNARYELTAVKPGQYPAGNMPEVAFVGRSNVGKSSFINTMLNRKNLARVGATPGKTREINFYNLDERVYFVDLPGYGYAKVSKTKKLSWDDVVETYLYSRMQLKLIIMLVDIRHSPSEDDRVMYEWLKGNSISSIVVASKADKISRNQLKARLLDIKSALGIEGEAMPIPFSSETKQGKEEVWSVIDKIILEGDSNAVNNQELR